MRPAYISQQCVNTLEVDELQVLYWYIDTAFAVHSLGWVFRRKQEHFLPSKRNDIPFVPASAGIPIGIFAFRNKS